jgi:hypothetical protein
VVIDRQSLRHAAWNAFADAYQAAVPDRSAELRLSPFGYVAGIDAVLDIVAVWLGERAKAYVGTESAQAARLALQAAAVTLSLPKGENHDRPTAAGA